MSQYLDNLTKHNDHPSDNVIVEVKQLLSVPLKQLEDTTAEINRLEELIRGLKEKRVEIEKSINRYSCVLAPIRRVPTDILHTIFWHCLPTHRNPTMAASESPMLLTRVCSSWRSTAMASPRLWAQIHIPFRKEIEVHGSQRGYPIIPLETVTDILQLRCHGVGEWLSRSGDCPLSISVGFHSDGSPIRYIFRADRTDKTTQLLLSTLLLFSSRWRTLELKVPMSFYCELERMLSASTLLMLAHLKAQIYYPGPNASETSQNQPPPALLRAPNLKRVSIDMPTIITPRRIFPHLTDLVPWNNVTHLSIFSPCTLQGCIALLKCYPRLIHCDISFEAFMGPYENLSIHETIYLPYLISLWINVAESPSFAPILYNWIETPKLRWIKYQNNTYMESPAGDHVPAMDAIPASFIQRATNLTRLVIDRFSFLPSNILDIFQMASQNTLTHLSLTSTRMYPGSIMTDPFDLETLIVDDVLDLTSTSQVLLPHLEVFELHITKVSDDTVLRFITSRLNTLSNTALLRKVKIRFDRLREQGGPDIAEEVRKRAEMAGVQMDVIFQYSPSALQVERHRNCLSPSFISPDYLSDDKTDRTWYFKELEEYDSDII